MNELKNGLYVFRNGGKIVTKEGKELLFKNGDFFNLKDGFFCMNTSCDFLVKKRNNHFRGIYELNKINGDIIYIEKSEAKLLMLMKSILGVKKA